MLLSEIVSTSERVAATQKRLEKIALLAECIRRLPRNEMEIGIRHYRRRLCLVAIAPCARALNPGLGQRGQCVLESGITPI